MKIEKCTIKDAQKLSDLIASNLPDISGVKRPTALADLRAHNSAENLSFFFRHIISGNFAEVYILRDKEQIAGCFKISMDNGYEDGWLTGEIEFCYILDAYRGHTYGSRCLEYIESRFKTLGYGKLYTWISNRDRDSQRFYEKHGFSFEGHERQVLFNETLSERRYHKKIASTIIIKHVPSWFGHIKAVEVRPAHLNLPDEAVVAPASARIFNLNLDAFAEVFSLNPLANEM